MIKLAKLFLTLSIALMLAACYRIDVQQGNILPSSSLKKVHNGMTTAQIRQMFGTPALTNPFAGNDLVYVYTFKPGVGARQEKRLIIYFRKDRVTSFTVDDKHPSDHIPTPH